jgi:hypothetical protein
MVEDHGELFGANILFGYSIAMGPIKYTTRE